MRGALEIEVLDVHDDEAMRAWYDAYRAAVTYQREYHMAFAYEEVLAAFRADSPGRWMQSYTALVDRRVVGVGGVTLPLNDNRTVAMIDVAIVPEHRGRGFGGAVHDHVEAVARGRGRTVLWAEVGYPASYGERGTGHPDVQFALDRGYTFGLGDVQRVRDLPVPEDLLDRLAAESAPHHEGYTLCAYTGTPEDLLLDLGRLRAAVETEAPAGEMEREPEHVDTAHVAAEEAELGQAGRVRHGVVAISAGGEVAGYTEMVVPAFDPEWVYQWGTLVWSAHRGHRLGMALKVANLRQLQSRVAGRRAVRTWNAEVNAPMVAVNEALGFRVVERLGEFQKRL